MQGLELEKRRHEVLAELDILDTPPEPAFDHLTGLAKDLFDVPIALISLIDSERQWFKSCVGLDVRSTPREVAFCDIAIRDDNVMVVPDASIDERFNCNPLVTGAPHIQFYAGAPVRYRDVLIGTLCIIDRKARSDFGKSEAKKLSKLADAVSAVLVMRKEGTALAFESGNRKILLVDDHTVNRQMIKALLSPYAAYIEEAVDGAEAVIKCKEIYRPEYQWPSFPRNRQRSWPRSYPRQYGHG